MLERRGEREVWVSVSDDGRGMELQPSSTGLGLVGLRERVEALNGRLRMSSSHGRGLEVTASLPVDVPEVSKAVR